jgi:hypothetical protein
MVKAPLPDMANGPGNIDRQEIAAPGRKLPKQRQIPENAAAQPLLTTFGTAVAWEGRKAAVWPVRT